MTSTPEHWDDRYRTVGSTQVSWFQDEPRQSLRLIREVVAPQKGVGIVDVGGGASSLVDALVADGFRDVTVVDLSQVALDEAAARIAASDATEGRDAHVAWVQADVREWTPIRSFDLWHDRAVSHFLTEPADRARYWQLVRDHVAPGGHVVIGTFAEDGPTMCSGLPVARSSAAGLLAELGDAFEVVTTEREVHVTPAGGDQSFSWVVARRR